MVGAWCNECGKVHYVCDCLNFSIHLASWSLSRQNRALNSPKTTFKRKYKFTSSESKQSPKYMNRNPKMKTVHTNLETRTLHSEVYKAYKNFLRSYSTIIKASLNKCFRHRTTKTLLSCV